MSRRRAQKEDPAMAEGLTGTLGPLPGRRASRRRGETFACAPPRGGLAFGVVGHVLVVSSSQALQVLLARLLKQQGHSTAQARDGDEGFSSIVVARPAVVILDLRDGDADSLLFHGLLRKRHPGLPVLSLVADRLRLCDRDRDVLVEPTAADHRTPHPVLSALRRSVDDVVTIASLQTWKPAPGLA
jgi:CheY-like chemotaxis protein